LILKLGLHVVERMHASGFRSIESSSIDEVSRI
jgi:hypothetical protein